MRIAFGKPGIFCWGETRVHAGEYRELPRWRQGQLRFGAKTRGIGFIGFQHFLQNRHA
jgi:hypothetical protein